MTTTAHETLERARFASEWEDWHRAHEARRADPHGFLAVTALFWIAEESQTFPGIPGRWRTSLDGPVVELEEGEWLRLGDATITGRHAFGAIAERGGVTVGFDGGVIEVARRGGRDILRPRRPDFPFLGSYRGTPAYAPDPKWRVEATFVRYAAPRRHEVGAAVDGLSHVYESPGYLEFDIDDETFRLVAFPGHAEGTLTVLFTDATSGRTTYAANRSLSVDAPGADGRTVVDFTRAVNLPCAYTDFATCPLPPAENRLTVAVEAGEKTPVARAEGEVTARGIEPTGTAR
ncbi:DUF1684 domain-containing protein [Microbacterium proteolyticum]|uniref:DUF1684 domain-containing protein n=1 Tax=Microbacterium proteolyticum TaxID=1572644 RepID=UPI0024169170|nr:DUF1684 domain-containing protein [Microbacterium proteolyticum]